MYGLEAESESLCALGSCPSLEIFVAADVASYQDCRLDGTDATCDETEAERGIEDVDGWEV